MKKEYLTPVINRDLAMCCLENDTLDNIDLDIVVMILHLEMHGEVFVKH
jgi:hypothetical protein